MEKMSLAQARRAYKEALHLAQSDDYDPEHVIGLLTKAATAGHGVAAAALASWYLYGKHVRKKFKQAVEWFKTAAELGNAEGLYGLAGAYERGIGGLPKDERKAFELYTNQHWQGRNSLFEKLRVATYTASEPPLTKRLDTYG